MIGLQAPPLTQPRFQTGQMEALRSGRPIVTPPTPPSCSLWKDSFTDSNAVNLASHIPETGSGYTGITGTLETISNKIQVVGTGSAYYSFDPGVVNTSCSIDFNFVDTGNTDLRFVYFGFRFASGQQIIAGVGRFSGTWTLIVQDSFTGSYSWDQTITITANTWYTLVATNNGSSVSATLGATSVNLSTSTHATATLMLLEVESGSYGTGGILLDNLCIN